MDSPPGTSLDPVWPERVALAGWLASGWRGGFGPKNFAQRMITANDNSEATRIRSSGVNLSFCPGALMSAPQSSDLSVRLNWLASLPISPEPGRNQICARADGSAAAASVQAKRRAPRQSVQSPRRHSANTSVRIGNFPRTRSTNTFCRTAARAAPRLREWIGLLFVYRRFVYHPFVQGRTSVRPLRQRPL